MQLYIRCMLFCLVLVPGPGAQAANTDKETLPVLAKPFAATDFELTGEDGRNYRLSDYRGQVVLINFWASWCPPCRYEMPALERLWQQVRDKGIVILAVNVGEDRDTIFEFMGQYPMSFPLPMDLKGEVVKSYPVTGLPTSYVVDPEGLVTHRAVGGREWDAPQLIQQLLKMRK